MAWSTGPSSVPSGLDYSHAALSTFGLWPNVFQLSSSALSMHNDLKHSLAPCSLSMRASLH